jgi:hypothetical protein
MQGFLFGLQTKKERELCPLKPQAKTGEASNPLDLPELTPVPSLLRKEGCLFNKILISREAWQGFFFVKQP